VADPEVSEEVPDKPASDGDLLGRLRGRLKLIGGALASVAAVGAVASGGKLLLPRSSLCPQNSQVFGRYRQ